MSAPCRRDRSFFQPHLIAPYSLALYDALHASNHCQSLLRSHRSYMLACRYGGRSRHQLFLLATSAFRSASNKSSRRARDVAKPQGYKRPDSRPDNAPRASDIASPTPLPRSKVFIYGFGTIAFVSGLYVFQIWHSVSKPAQLNIDVSPDEPTTPVYDTTAQYYDSAVDSVEYWQGITSLRRKLTHQLFGNVLEVAVGTGRNSQFYELKNCRSVTMIDGSGPMLEIARKRWSELMRLPEWRLDAPERIRRIEIRQMSADDEIPLPASTAAPDGKVIAGFTSILSTFSLCSLPHPAETLAHLCTMLSPPSPTADQSQQPRVLLLEHGRSHYDWLNRLLDNSAPAHAKEHGCWWNKDIGAIAQKAADAAGMEIFYQAIVSQATSAIPPDAQTIPSQGSSTEGTALDRFTRSIIEGFSPFACGGGSVRISENPGADMFASITSNLTVKPVQIHFGPNGSGRVLTFPAGAEDAESLQHLIGSCTDSKLDASAFATTFSPYETGIIDAVSQLLLPQITIKNASGVRAELSELNIHRAPGGKFKVQEMPETPTEFGLLIVCLPVGHQGGELTIRHPTMVSTFDWSQKCPEEDSGETLRRDILDHLDNPPPHLHWAVFTSECDHEFLEVKEGTRITLTYKLHARPCHGTLLAGGLSPLDPRQLRLYIDLKTALRDPTFFPAGRFLGVGLSHRYGHTSTEVDAFPSLLRGADMHLYEACRALRLECELLPVVEVAYNGSGLEERPINFVGERIHRYTEGGFLAKGAAIPNMVHSLWNPVDASVFWLRYLSWKYEEPAFSYIEEGDEGRVRTVSSVMAMFIHGPSLQDRVARLDYL
ncbi:hypothetical protein NA57DRAFT_58069 [Rhizodiscina lignyota]|uniref:Methyltransferase domain-containing protein n=1 Tax=Rhizodiscina lignyota TaxID=1504668 RepID=A0A9P4IB58_9PEZI|nr:hypothetical protein NA57DRAFT_58069 [Rhizodiscina lignyota]